LSQADAEDNLIKMAAAPISGELKDLAEMDFLQTKYADQPEVRGRLITIHKHNPLGSYQIQDILAMQAAGTVKKIDVTLSIYINAFVAQLLSENTDFLDLDFAKQKELLYQMAEIKQEELDTQEEEASAKEQAFIDANTKQLVNTELLVPDQIENSEMKDPQRKKERNSLDNA
jgi:hypothetical protein